jgi:hypothetical protein
LADWILADAKLTPSMNAPLLELTGKTSFHGKRDSSKMSPEMRICQDIANASKHARITMYTPDVKSVSFTDGTYGSAIYGFSRYGDSSRRFAVGTVDTMHDAQEVIKQVIAQYNSFFEDWSLI